MTWKNRLPLVVESAIPLSLCGALMDHVKNQTARPRTYQGLIDESLRKSEMRAALLTEAVRKSLVRSR
ncbi:hypothetical protein J7F03_00490 [Streptomyces sp. ISL-43]|uniref:hypothetical protein n=1 Tax=Streptomyces sp. ISL-43 TaxID=2819183 RepID=UPI001BE5B760|nr:hypothetical protein [Streptomyces sp. ISL-43]MBT2445588.1 hypothetical protein [Streptomyces sp. ISL-43]